MNKTRLSQLFNNYIEKFEYINNPDFNETYKWAVVEQYRESFNLDAPDLSAGAQAHAIQPPGDAAEAVPPSVGGSGNR